MTGPTVRINKASDESAALHRIFESEDAIVDLESCLDGLRSVTIDLPGSYEYSGAIVYLTAAAVQHVRELRDTLWPEAKK